MQGIVLRWVLTTIGILIVPQLVAGVSVKGFPSALAAAAILGVLNAVVRPVLIILTLPLTFVTLGFFILVINALLFELAGAIVPGVVVESFWSALWASLIVSAVSWITNYAIAGTRADPHVAGYRQDDDDTVTLQRGKDGRWE